MASLIFGKDEMLAAWAAKKIAHIGTPEDFGPFKAVGVATGPTAKDRLMAVCVFHSYFPKERHCQISMASCDPRWATRRTVRELLAFPFLQYGCHLVWTGTPHTAERVIRFNKALGFTQEAVLADRFGPGVHAVVCRLRYKDYDRLYLHDRKEPERRVAAN